MGEEKENVSPTFEFRNSLTARWGSHMRFLFALCLATLLSVPTFCATVPEGIVKTVVFIYRGQNGAAGQPDGTGFLVGLPNTSHPGQSWLYLVTAKHVLHTDPNNISSPMYPDLFVRINKKSGGSQVFRLPITDSGDKQSVFFSPDSSVDVAVFPIGIPNADQFDVVFLPEDMLVTRADFAKYKIGIGTDTFFTGMFTPVLGQSKNIPIVRFGRLAMLPDEKIPWGTESIDAYLVETFSFGGNSGSPVFFYPSADNTPGMMVLGPAVIKIAGVMKGFFGDLEPITMAQTASTGQQIPASQQNSGIAIVIPAEHIREILDSPELASKRQPAP